MDPIINTLLIRLLWRFIIQQLDSKMIAKMWQVNSTGSDFDKNQDQSCCDPKAR
jgi:hypothetical protein